MEDKVWAELAEGISESYFLDELLTLDCASELIEFLGVDADAVPFLVLEAVRIKLQRLIEAH